MTTTNVKKTASVPVQDVCIDLPGETVQCWRSSDKVKVTLRKHRDIIFDINLQHGALYTVESKGSFYCPVLKKLLRKVDFLNGDICHIWTGRDFKDKLVLKMNGRVLGEYQVNKLDATNYGKDPKEKPEPMMVVMGKKTSSVPLLCTPDDPLGVTSAQSSLMSGFESNFSILRDVGTKFDYTFLHQSPDVREYVAVTEAFPHEIHPEMLAKLEKGDAVGGNAAKIFFPPKEGQFSSLYIALFTAAGYISGNQFLTGSVFKETTGYLMEHFRKLDQIAMVVHVQGKIKGKFRVALKGYLVSDVFGVLTGKVEKLKHRHINVPVGSEKSAFIDGGFKRSGKAGYGGLKRIMMTGAENFGKGMKIQVIGTVIDLIVDVNAVYFDEKGSRDLSEFLGRAGVSIVKAGATAAIGTAIAAVGTAGLSMLIAGALPVGIVAIIVVAGFIGAAILIDKIDARYGIKDSAADWAR